MCVSSIEVYVSYLPIYYLPSYIILRPMPSKNPPIPLSPMYTLYTRKICLRTRSVTGVHHDLRTDVVVLYRRSACPSHPLAYPSWYNCILGIAYLIVSLVSVGTNVRYILPSNYCMFYYVSMRLISTSINQWLLWFCLASLRSCYRNDVYLSLPVQTNHTATLGFYCSEHSLAGSVILAFVLWLRHATNALLS